MASPNVTASLSEHLMTYAAEMFPVLNSEVNFTPEDLGLPSGLPHEDDGDYNMNAFFYKGDIEQLRKPWVREPHFIPLVLVYSIVFITGVTSNSLVITVLCCGRAGRSVTFPCLLSMAWADVLFLLVCVPHAVVTHFISHWTLSDFLCKLSGFVESLSANATVLNLILISVERYFVIAHPLSSKSMCTSRNARIALVCTWVASTLLACPAFVVMGTESNMYYNNSTSVVVVLCADIGVTNQDRLVYALWKLVSLFVVPTAILLYCYARVIAILWLSTQQLQTMTSPSRFSTCHGYTDHCHSPALNGGSPQLRLRSSPSVRAAEDALVARKQVIKMLIIIILVFLVCWGPKLVVQVMKIYHVSALYTPSAFIAIMVINCLPYFQSCINPIIYVMMSRNIRKSVLQILNCLACKRCARRQWVESPSHELIPTNHTHVMGVRSSIDIVTCHTYGGLNQSSPHNL